MAGGSRESCKAKLVSVNRSFGLGSGARGRGARLYVMLTSVCGRYGALGISAFTGEATGNRIVCVGVDTVE